MELSATFLLHVLLFWLSYHEDFKLCAVKLMCNICFYLLFELRHKYSQHIRKGHLLNHQTFTLYVLTITNLVHDVKTLFITQKKLYDVKSLFCARRNSMDFACNQISTLHILAYSKIIINVRIKGVNDMWTQYSLHAL